LPLAAVRTWLECLLIHICSEHELPFPAVNVPLLGYEVDFYWERERFVVEADGGDHLTPRQRDKDNERDITFGRAGLLVRRYSSTAMDDEAAVAMEVLSILEERRKSPLGSLSPR
jgi:very-short-patch-repair endonuclease